MSLGRKLKDAREALDLSQADVGREVGVTGQTIYLWETGRSRPLRKYVNALAATLHLSRAELLLGDFPADAPASVEELVEKLRRAVAVRHGVAADQVSVDIAIAILPDNV
nr:helix-turn-helix transcriptional regulator [Brevundimonas diminuta]